MQLVLFVQMEAYIHIKVSSQCSLKNKQGSDENGVCINFQSLEFPYVGVLHTAVIQNNNQAVRYVTQQLMNQWLILEIIPGHWLQSPGSEFLILESGEHNLIFLPLFFLSVLSAICSPLSPHSRSIANPSLGQFTCRLRTRNVCLSLKC